MRQSLISRSYEERLSVDFCVVEEEVMSDARAMNWVQRKIYLYNVTFGLYMLDWWERYLFNTLVVVLMWFVLYNGSRYVSELCKRHLW